MSNKKEIIGVSGWLILVEIIVFIQPFAIVYNLVSVFHMDSFSMWSILDGPTKYRLIFEYILNLLFIIVSLYVIVLFFKKKERFKVTFLVYLITLAIVTIIDFAWKYFLFDNVSISGLINLNHLIGAITPALILGPYIILSRRVKNTFVN
tara:strand:- start:108 stop:557 length:450 start_codon:yes stop_codon:yes gene_type:complete